MLKRTKTHVVPWGGPILKSWGGGISGFRVLNRLPAFPVSGVKNPAPVAIGTGFGGGSSGGVRLTGAGRGGNRVSISGIESDVSVWLEGPTCKP